MNEYKLLDLLMDVRCWRENYLPHRYNAYLNLFLFANQWFNSCFQSWDRIVYLIASMLSVFTFFPIYSFDVFCASHLQNLEIDKNLWHHRTIHKWKLSIPDLYINTYGVAYINQIFLFHSTQTKICWNVLVKFI